VRERWAADPCLPYGVFDDGSGPRVGVRVGDQVLDVGDVAPQVLPGHAQLLEGGSLDRLLAAGRLAWDAVRAGVQRCGADPSLHGIVASALRPLSDVALRLPFTVADYVDFYSSEHHARNVGRLFRPDGDPLPPAWRHLPMGYHGRAGTVVVSGTDVLRPWGLVRRDDDDGAVVVAPTSRLDVEVEVGFVVGRASSPGRPVPLDRFDEHVFGVCLVDDWSARDVQAFEYVPLGPMLGKSFATSVSPWIVPLSALAYARVDPPPRDPTPAAHLDDVEEEPWGLDVQLELRLNGHVVSRPPLRSTYWTGAQQLAHLTSNGAHVRTGDLYASGTVSGPSSDSWGSLLELTADGPLQLPDGTRRTFLEDGDEVVISATAPGPMGVVLDLGEVRGRVVSGPR
jgi:fumarylacetoacetase